MEIGIPIVDLSKFVEGAVEEKMDFVNRLGKAYEEVGFVAVKNHGISQQLIDNFYHKVEAFFSMNQDLKAKYEIPGLAGQRGYTSFGKEHAKGSEAPDLKEFWQIGQEVKDGDKIESEYPSNVYVEELPEFNKMGRMLYTEFEKAGGYLLKAIALYLDLHENYFDEKIHNGNSILRAIHYPPIKEEPKSSIRAEQHEDINLITLLVGASADGLQLLNKENNWMDISAPQGYIVVNVGDMLQRLTNNKLKSTTHRVVNPSREKWHTHRFSIPFFLHPRSDMPLDCLESCIDEGQTLHYEPITAGEYLEERLVEIGLLKK